MNKQYGILDWFNYEGHDELENIEFFDDKGEVERAAKIRNQNKNTTVIVYEFHIENNKIVNIEELSGFFKGGCENES